MNFRVSHARGYILACEPVVYTPADVSGAGVCPVGPPGIGAGSIGVSGAEGIDVAGGDKGIEAFTLFVGETVFANVWLGVSQVDFIVSDVKVAAKQYGFRFFKLLNVCEERGVPLRMAKCYTA